MDRSASRYRLHRLGWKAFQDLCVTLLQEIVSARLQPFSEGGDLGRDGFFQGTITAGSLGDSDLTGKLVLQCKFSSNGAHAFSSSLVKREVSKVAALAASGELNHYALLTNLRVSSEVEREIRGLFCALPGLETCHVFGEAWIETRIDGNWRLLRRVPRLYGIGDLTQILAAPVVARTEAIIDDLVALRTFVATGAYRRAVEVLETKGLVMLIGGPASGKTTIAANICNILSSESSDIEVVRIGVADELQSTLSIEDTRRIYWFDDAFGELNFDQGRLNYWSATFLSLEAALRRGARMIFTSRDYIFRDVQDHMKRAKLTVLNDASVVIDVANLSDDEREEILYNHIKYGDLPGARRTSLKPYLARLAKKSTFTPELARRLGTNRFFPGVGAYPTRVDEFFDTPVGFLKEVVGELAALDQGAMYLILLNGNRPVDPVTEAALSPVLRSTFSVEVASVRRSLRRLEGSLVRLERSGNDAHWKVHHPTMLEALQETLASESTLLDLYVAGASFRALARDSTMVLKEARRVFIPSSLYHAFACRLAAERDGSDRMAMDYLAEFLATRATDTFIRLLVDAFPDVLEAALSVGPDQADEEDLGVEFAIRLRGLHLAGSVVDEVLEARVRREVFEEGKLFVLLNDRCREALGEGAATNLIVEAARAPGRTLRGVRSRVWDDSASAEEMASALSQLEEEADGLVVALASVGFSKEDGWADAIRAERRTVEWDIEQAIAEAEDAERRTERGRPTPTRNLRGVSTGPDGRRDRFSDVDE